MSVLEVTDRFLEAWAAGPEKDGVPYTLAVCNLANPDMVGHTGVIEAAVKALEYVDGCVARWWKLCSVRRPRADDGGPRKCRGDAGRNRASPDGPHLQSGSWLWWSGRGRGAGRSVAFRRQAWDIAPTLLDLWGLAKPGVMSGESLVEGVRGESFLSSRAARAAGEHGACLFLSLPRLRARYPLIAPTQPSHDPLRVLWGAFPRHAGDERTVHYVKIMLATAAPLWILISHSFWGIIGGRGEETFLEKVSSPLPRTPSSHLPMIFDWWGGRATAFPFLFEQLLNAIKLPQSCVWDIVLMVGEP